MAGMNCYIAEVRFSLKFLLILLKHCANSQYQPFAAQANGTGSGFDGSSDFYMTAVIEPVCSSSFSAVFWSFLVDIDCSAFLESNFLSAHPFERNIAFEKGVRQKFG